MAGESMKMPGDSRSILVGSEKRSSRWSMNLPSVAIHAVFVLSGVSALLYQMAWQRALMLIYGSNIESVAMVVSAFLVGLGLGSLAGGAASVWIKVSPVGLFALAELAVGIFGVFSMPLFTWVGRYTLTAGTLQTGLLVFGLVLLPTFLMGATLPLLVAHRVQMTGQVGQSVSWLYFVNTLGAAAGAFLAVFTILGTLGLSGSVHLAALLNFISAAFVFLTCKNTGNSR
jgi:predicted membrane-bound spermidine synthase